MKYSIIVLLLWLAIGVNAQKQYKVKWTTMTTVMTGCPISPLIYDEFGRVIGGGERQGELCYTTTYDSSYKVFYNRDSAISMYERGKQPVYHNRQDGFYSPDPRIINISIDSAELKKQHK